MTNILDSVEPDAWRYNKVRGLNKEQCSSVDPLYSRETVESLLQAHRKQVLLEAAEHCRSLKSKEKPRDAAAIWQDEAFEIAAAELRRMAEGEKE